MPDARYWVALVVLVVVGLAVRVLRGGPLLPAARTSVLGRLDLVVALVAFLALGFHCAAMFFPSVVAAPGTDGAARAVRELGAASQVAYWVPAVLLLVALRRAWAPLLFAETVVLLAVGGTMFWDFGLPAHLIAIAGSVATTVAVLTTMTTRPVPRRPVPA